MVISTYVNKNNIDIAYTKSGIIEIKIRTTYTFSTKRLSDFLSKNFKTSQFLLFFNLFNMFWDTLV